jgi:hypothetical protein
MSIKKLIVGSIFSILLGSEMAAADWGDMYYCQMTNFDATTLEGKKFQFKLKKFQFKLDQTKNAMVFGSTGHFRDTVDELTTGRNWPSQERWYANDTVGSTYFEGGKFMYTQNGVLGALVVSANCDKF